MPSNDIDSSDISPSDNSPSEGDPDSEDKQATESGTESNSSPKPEQSSESKTSSSFSDSSSDKPTKKRDIFAGKDNGGSPTFPVKLHLILSNPEFEKIVAWLPHGRAWRILDHKALEEKVIPLYFRHGRYSSFARQINGWGFKRIVHGADYNAYYHEMFLRGMPHLCAKMKRPTSKATSNKEQVDPSDPAPDFYAMSRLQPLPEPGSGEVPSQLGDTMEIEKVTKAAVVEDSTDTSSVSRQESRFVAPPKDNAKSDVLEQIAQMLNQNALQQQKQAIPNFGGAAQGNPQLAAILSLLNGGVAAAPPKPAVSPQNQLQQLLSGLNGINNWNPQAQLTALIQQQMQPPQQQQKNPQQLLASFLNQNTGQNNQGDMISNLLNQGGPQSILNLLMTPGQNQTQMNPNDLLQTLTNQLQQKPQSQVSLQNQGKGAQKQQAQPGPKERQQSADQFSEDDPVDKSDNSATGQGPAKRQRQSRDVDISTAQPIQGSQQADPISGALSQLLQSMSQKPPASSTPKPLDILSMLQQPNHTPQAQQQSKSNNALSNVLALLQQRGLQGYNNPTQTPADALLSALKQQGGMPPQTQQKATGSQDTVAGLLQQLLGGSHQGQNTQQPESSGNHVLDALQSLVRPSQPATQPPSTPLAQLQHLLGQQQPPMAQAPFPFASMQPRNSGNNPNAAMLQQLLNNNNPSTNQEPPRGINAELLASLGLSAGGPSPASQTPNRGPAPATVSQPTSRNQQGGINQDILSSFGTGTSSAASGNTTTPTVGQSSNNGSNSVNSELLNSMGFAQHGQSQEQSSGNQQNNESAARSVAAILSAFNQGNKKGN